MKRTIANLVVLLLACVLGACDLFTSPERRLDRAEQLESRGQFREAMIELRNVLDQEPGDARAQLLVARVGYMLGDLDGSEKMLASAQTAGAAPAKVADLRARLLLAEGKHELLLSELEDVHLSLSGERREVFRLQALAGLNRCLEAIELGRALLARNLRLSEPRVAIADCQARSGDSLAALAELDAGITAIPDAADLRVARGRLLRLAHRPREAQQAWIDAASRASGQLTMVQHVALLATLAELQLERNDVPGARETIGRLKELAPEGGATQVLVAELQFTDGRSDVAIATARQIILKNPDFATAHRTLAAALLLEGRYEQARTEITWLEQRSITSRGARVARGFVDRLNDPDLRDEERWLRIAAALDSLGEPTAARAAISKALRAEPTSARAQTMIATLDLRAQNFDSAIKIATHRLSSEPADVAALALFCDASIGLGQQARAVEEFERLWERHPSAALAVAMYRARKSGAMGNELEPLSRWLQRSAGDLAVRTLYADGLRLSGATRESIVNYEKIVTTAPRDAAALNNLAWLYYLEGDARAVPMARRALALTPKIPAVQDTMGWLLVETGELKEGTELLARVAETSGVDYPDAQYHYAAALARSGQREEALNWLNRLLAARPQFSTRPQAEALATTLR